MKENATLQRTALNAAQKSMGARMVDFHGWELPVQFSSILKEHEAVRRAAGLFDVSHMGQFFLKGEGALDFLQRVNSNDVSRIGPGKAIYSHLLNERGTIVDDVIVSCLGPGRYLMVVNAATREKDFGWLKGHSGSFAVTLSDRSEALGMLALQGPGAEAVAAQLVPSAVKLPRFGAAEVESFRGSHLVLTRTGYTGEDGFEFIVPNELLVGLWEELLEKGKAHGILPCGLGARDTLRLEAGYLLYGQDADEETTPLEANYGWVVKWEKEFLAKPALLKQKREGLSRRLAGVRLKGPGVPRPGASILQNGRKIAALASATFSPTLGVGIGTGYLPVPGPQAGDSLEVELRGHVAAAEAADLPFYKREKTHA